MTLHTPRQFRRVRLDLRHALAVILGGAILVAGSIFASSPANAVVPTVGLGTAASYSVLAGSAVDSTGETRLGGDLGISPSMAVTGFGGGAGQGMVSGATHIGDTPAQVAQQARLAAYTDAKSRIDGTTISGDVGGQSFPPGIYTASAALAVTGTLELDGENDPNSVFIFQIGSALDTAAASKISLINGASACNVFWQVGSSATLGAGSSFVGTILADASVTVGLRTTIDGRVLVGAAVTLAENNISTTNCGATGTDGDVDGTDTGAGVDSVGGTDTGAGSGVDSVGGTDTGAGSGVDSVGGTDTGAGTGVDSVGGTDTGAGGVSDSVAGTDSVSDAGVTTGTPDLPDTGAPSGLGTTMWLGLMLLVVGFVVAAGSRLVGVPTGRHRRP